MELCSIQKLEIKKSSKNSFKCRFFDNSTFNQQIAFYVQTILRDNFVEQKLNYSPILTKLNQFCFVQK